MADKQQKAVEAKNKGNDAFQKKDFGAAVKYFTEAIDLDPGNHVLFSNRSGAYASLGDYQKALEDANKCVELKPDWVKGYTRKATAHMFLGKLDEALEDYNAGLKIEPENEQCKKGIKEVEQQLQEQSAAGLGKAFGPEMWAKLTLDPRTKEFMKQQDFVQILQLIQKNPQLLSNFIQDQRVLTALGVLMGINLSTAGGEGDPMQTENASEEKADSEPMKDAFRESPKSQSQPQPQSQPTKMEQEPDTPQKKAEKEKELGNTAYKNKQFEEALKHYNNAKEFDPENMIYYLNTAAVKLEMGQSEESIAECTKGIEIGKAHRAPYETVAKAYARMGNAYAKLDKLEDALKAYNTSLTEHRSADVLKKVQEVGKLKKERDTKAYIDPQKAKESKDKGNEYFKNADYPNAIKCYTEAMKRDPTDYVLYSNRAACYTKLAEYLLGMNDCDKCIELNPNFAKVYSRKGLLYYMKKDYAKAIEAYERGLKIDPENKELKDGLSAVIEAFNKQQSSAPDEDSLKKAMQDPEVQAIVGDPVMQQILNDMKNDPRAAAEHMKNPAIKAKVMKLASAGIIRLG
jgi:stress-induced-phosphoprotein 1